MELAFDIPFVTKELYGALKAIGESLGSLVFEEKCRICRISVDAAFAINQQANLPPAKTVCRTCWAELTGQTPICQFMNIGGGRELTIISGASYCGSLRDVIRKFKYNDDRLLASDLATLIFPCWQRLKELHLDQDLASTPPAQIILLPVPLHKNKLKQRGFNQAEQISHCLSNLVKAPIDRQALVRVKDTAPQFGLNKVERRANLQEAFVVASDSLSSKHVVLVDDVFTSGATLREAANAVIAAGAEAVYALTIARA